MLVDLRELLVRERRHDVAGLACGELTDERQP
jgi:hypothetical protein